MNILILDDNEILFRPPSSAAWLQHAIDYTKQDVTQTKNPKTFLGLLFDREWDQVWIDHDLGIETTGRDVTRSIYDRVLGKGKRVPGNPHVYITTMNVSAAHTMASDIRGCRLSVVVCPISSMGDMGVRRGSPL